MAGILITAVVWGYISTPKTVPCVAMQYTIEDASERKYLTEGELNSLLRAEDIYPVGRAQNIISLHRIETTVLRHPMVRTAECYLTPRNEVRVRLTQREPLVRVQVPGETYFIDTDRRVMPYRPTVQDSVLLVTGTVGVQMASGAIADFAEWLQSDKYWRKRVHHVYVQSPLMVYIYFKDPNQPRVVMGSMRNYERKLRKLHTFYENSSEAIQGKHYTEYDIRFRGQVIGRR